MSHLVTLMPKPDNSLVLLRDMFTDTDGVTLPNHTPDYNLPGNAWETLVLQISSNTAVNTAAAEASGVINLGCSDVFLEAVCNAGTDIAGIAFRYTDSNNHWSVYANAASAALEIWQKATTFTKRATVAFTPSGAFVLKVTVIGPVIAAAIGATRVSYASMAADLTATKHGMRLGDTGTASSIDSIIARKP